MKRNVRTVANNFRLSLLIPPGNQSYQWLLIKLPDFNLLIKITGTADVLQLIGPRFDPYLQSAHANIAVSANWSSVIC